MSEKFKNRDRVRVINADGNDREAGIKERMVGTVIDAGNERAIVRVWFDLSENDRNDSAAWWMTDEQLELVEDEKSPGLPPAAAPVYVLTNAELQAAIEKTHALRMSTGNPESVRMLNDHLGGLLKVQLARASQEPAA